MECLASYFFPGNIRELENEIERAVAMVENNGMIDLEHLSGKLREQAGCGDNGFPLCTTLKRMVEELEVKALKNAMQKHGGNKTLAARELGLSRFGLLKKIKRYKL
jgi:transcriptional regulator with PAS, ATPase and Fis domain